MSELDKILAAALKKQERNALRHAFDAEYPESRPTPKQIEIMQDISEVQMRYVVAGNQSGKTQIGGREVSWILNDEHPYWTRPKHWRGPLLIIVAAQNLLLAETEIWRHKIQPFLKGDWKEDRLGSVLKRCINRKTGDTIVFLSHSDGSEKNRKHMQGFVANYVWLDEMPSSKVILEELQRRVDARQGPFLATFTPKIRNDEIRRIVDASVFPVAKKYTMSKLDNPIYAERIEDEISKLEGYSNSYKNTVLYGEWSTGDCAVYYFDYELMTVSEMPEGYHRGWRHTCAVDPALKSKCGFNLWAEHPNSGIWYLISDDYIEDVLDGDSLVNTVEKRLEGYNVVRRISDTMAWFVGSASKLGFSYLQPYSKNNRKDDLIKGLQAQLSRGNIKIGKWCTTFIEEIQNCQWSETSDRMINSSSYHTLDSAQYFCDMIPEYDESQAVKPWHVELRETNQKIKQSQNEANGLASAGRVKSRVARPINAWGRRRVFK